MKVFYKTLFGAMLVSPLAGNVYAQQQPANPGFEEAWTDCIPWTFYQNEGYFGQPSECVTGINPTGWCISIVSGMVSYIQGDEENPGGPNGFGATVVGDSVEGYNSAHAVKLVNTPNPYMAEQIVPAVSPKVALLANQRESQSLITPTLRPCGLTFCPIVILLLIQLL